MAKGSGFRVYHRGFRVEEEVGRFRGKVDVFLPREESVNLTIVRQAYPLATRSELVDYTYLFDWPGRVGARSRPRLPGTKRFWFHQPSPQN